MASQKQEQFERRAKLIEAIVGLAIKLWSDMDGLEEIEMLMKRRIRKNSEQFFRERAHQNKADVKEATRTGEIGGWNFDHVPSLDDDEPTERTRR